MQSYDRSTELISIHALREEGDFGVDRMTAMFCNFYPRPPRGGRQYMRGEVNQIAEISIHALREEGDAGEGVRRTYLWISIHALREEGDRGLCCST